MNHYPNHPQTQILHTLKLHPLCWVLAPTENTYSYEDWIGDPDEAYASEDSGALPIPDAVTKIDGDAIEPDEFESDYCWFLS